MSINDVLLLITPIGSAQVENVRPKRKKKAPAKKQPKVSQTEETSPLSGAPIQRGGRYRSDKKHK